MFQWITVGEDDVLFADFGQLVDAISRVAVWLTAALALVLVVFGVLCRVFRKDAMRSYFRILTGIIVGYAIAIGTIMLYLTFVEMVQKGEFQSLLVWPLVVFVGLAVVLSLLLVGFQVFSSSDRVKKTVSAVSLAVLAAAAIAVIVCLSIYYKDVIVPGEYYQVNQWVLILLSVVLIGVIAVLAFVFGKHAPVTDQTRSIVFAAVCITLSFALSYLRLFQMPQGGSITFASLVPLMIYSYLFGVRKGVFAGLIYGVLQAIQDPWLIHPMQFLLDYPIAFGAIGVAGMFRNVKAFAGKRQLAFTLGAVVASLLRYFAHVISGIYAFSVYAPEGFTPVAWGFLYNTFVFADILIAIVAGCLIFASRSFVRTAESFAAKNAPDPEQSSSADSDNH